MQIVLTCGSAVAILVRNAPALPSARDALAEAGLRLATGRADISIGRRPSGRPKLAPPYHELGVSLAGRGGLLLAGFAPHQCVGVDLEVDGPDVGRDPARLARDHFAPGEADAIASLDAADARDLFLRFWVAKEAALKATGRGIVDGLHWPDLSPMHPQLLASEPIRLEHPQTSGIKVALAISTIDAGIRVYCALATMDPVGAHQTPEGLSSRCLG